MLSDETVILSRKPLGTEVPHIVDPLALKKSVLHVEMNYTVGGGILYSSYTPLTLQ